jgi:NAD(P)-dependent dehydrogenase (short-subunit alcohol dehydrogenase family)
MTGQAQRADADGQRVALVTGGTAGIGHAVALRLARGGDRILFTGRDERRGAQVLEELRTIRPGVAHMFLPADLSLLGDTARLADAIACHTDRLDAVVFCAGVLSLVPEWTTEGLERTFVVNYLARYLLVQRLLPMLLRASSGRLVLVANAGKYGDSLDFDDLQHRRRGAGLAVAGRTQFANDLMAVELAERPEGTPVSVTCVYPGVVDTDVFRNARGLPRLARALAPAVQRLVAAPPATAAETPAFLAQASTATATATGGRFYGPAMSRRRIPGRARRPDRRSALWAASEELVRPYLVGEHPHRAQE